MPNHENSQNHETNATESPKTGWDDLAASDSFEEHLKKTLGEKADNEKAEDETSDDKGETEKAENEMSDTKTETELADEEPYSTKTEVELADSESYNTDKNETETADNASQKQALAEARAKRDASIVGNREAENAAIDKLLSESK